MKSNRKENYRSRENQLSKLSSAIFEPFLRLSETIFGAVEIYFLILLLIVLISLVLITLSLLLNSPTLIVLAISVLIVAWLPLGIIMRRLRLTEGAIPRPLKVLIEWTAFVGFLGLMCPDLITIKTLIGGSLVGFILFSVSLKINFLEKILISLVFLMCSMAIWDHFWPESYRSTARYIQSWSKVSQVAKDRGSINNETDAAITYGMVLRDISVLYQLSGERILTEYQVKIKSGAIVKIVDVKKAVIEIDGQGFIQIQMEKNNKSFVGGDKYFIEADYIQVASPKEVLR